MTVVNQMQTVLSRSHYCPLLDKVQFRRTLDFGMNMDHNVTNMAYLSCLNRQKMPIPISNQHIIFIHAWQIYVINQVFSVYDMNEDNLENM